MATTKASSSQASAPESYQLPEHFQTWIDRIAMQDGVTGTDAYLELWQWSKKQTREGQSEAVLEALLRETEEEGDRILAAYKQK